MEAGLIGASIRSFNAQKPFSFQNYPQTKARLDDLLKSMHKGVQTVILNGVDTEWTLANSMNNELSRMVFAQTGIGMTEELRRRYFKNNYEAKNAFMTRKTAGLNLSDRVWRYIGQFKTEIEMGLDHGIRNGLSATEMSRDIRKYLQQPDKLFRRVRDAHGQLQSSQQAKAYHPGQGVYRSNYKNALRLTATETNIAYRTADYLRTQQQDFVVGIEVALSSNHPIPDICNDLAGRYPKDFKFTGWHPLCRCHTVKILKTVDELLSDSDRIKDGEEPSPVSINQVNDMPPLFNSWTIANRVRIETAQKKGTLPYFLNDNKGYAGLK